MRSLAEWLEQQQRSHPSAIDLSLSRVREVARRLDLLTPDCRVITVGGTNGKGSTVACLDAMLRAAGLRCGRFTSPHLTRYNERICVGGVEASDVQLIEAFERIDAARAEITLTFFEYNALAALDVFRSSRVDVAVLEVGLGGRFDATNIIDADVAVVCSIGIDHVDWLGHTLEAIGREKAGIFRKGRPAILGSADLPRSVWAAVEEVGSRAVAAGRDYSFQEISVAGEVRWNFECGAFTLRDLPRPALAGIHQTANAATALAALTALGGIELTHANVSHALRTVRLPGRFQRVPGEVEWIFDVAHNVPAALGLAENLRSLPRARTIAVCGILGDKDLQGITAALSADIDAWVLVALDGPRAVSTRDLAQQLPGDARVLAHAADVTAGCKAARDAARPGDRIVVFGSFLTVGPALEFLGPEFVGL